MAYPPCSPKLESRVAEDKKYIFNNRDIFEAMTKPNLDQTNIKDKNGNVLLQSAQQLQQQHCPQRCCQLYNSECQCRPPLQLAVSDERLSEHASSAASRSPWHVRRSHSATLLALRPARQSPPCLHHLDLHNVTHSGNSSQYIYRQTT